MKKLIVEKEEGVAEVIDRVLAEEDGDITLVVPMGSALSRSARNFHLIKREADDAGKSISVESVDDGILALAKDGGIAASHPLWHGVRSPGTGAMSDIVPVELVASNSVPEKKSAPKRRGGKKKVEPVKLAVRDESDEDEEDGARARLRKNDKEEDATMEKEAGRFFNGKDDDDEDNDSDDREDTGPRRPMSRKFLWTTVGVIVLILIVLAIVTWGFGHASVTIDFKQMPWTDQGVFLADKSVAQINPATNVIPAQIFTSDKNTTQTFKASGSANVSLKAQGTITVYNAYSSSPQELVATTRFVTPSGQIFRITNDITVPGAQVTNGQIVPSSIDASIVADQPGTAYNEGPIAKLTIPGLEGSPKYDGFYGQIKGTTSGGFVGTKPVPTAADITNAKASTTAVLESILTSGITTSYPNNFKILDDATSVTVTKLTVSTTTDQNGNFSVFGEATLQAIGFDQTAFEAFLLSLAQSQEQSSTFSSLTLTYSSGTPNFAKGQLNFSVSAQGTLEPAFIASNFKAMIAGESISQARQAVADLPELANGTISVWPMWLWSIPSNQGRIAVTAN